jgi:hypothetical protein
VARAEVDGVQEAEPSAPRTLRITNRDLATLVLAQGGTLLSMQHQEYSNGWFYTVDDTDGLASATLRAWGGREPLLVDARDYAGAQALMRRVLRDGIRPGEEVRYTVRGTHEHGRAA